MLAAVPPVCELGRAHGWTPLPLTVDEARPFAASLRALPAKAVAAPGDELLAVDGLTVAYRDQVALCGASFVVREGEVVALVGANGSGKSTLFRAIAGLTQPASGIVRLRGAVAPTSVQARTATAGLVPQDPAIALYHETVREEVAETLHHRAKSTTAALPGTALERWGVAELAGRNPRDISVGQQQRVALAAMLAHEPPVWLLDEPTRGADGVAKAWLAAHLRDHAARGGAAIVATHDIESAARYATRVVALDGGRVVHDLPAAVAFAADGPFPTQVARLVAGAVVVEDVAP
jgi:energy-coupling factor transport system ATP-binding protein